MNQNKIATIVIIITIMASLLLFIMSDHSGLYVQDCVFEQESNQQDTYNFNYSLLAGRHFNYLDCQYIIYSENNETITKGNTILENVHTGIYPIHEQIKLKENKTFNPRRIDFIIYNRISYEEDGVNKTRMEKAYNKTVPL